MNRKPADFSRFPIKAVVISCFAWIFVWIFAHVSRPHSQHVNIKTKKIYIFHHVYVRRQIYWMYFYVHNMLSCFAFWFLALNISHCDVKSNRLPLWQCNQVFICKCYFQYCLNYSCLFKTRKCISTLQRGTDESGMSVRSTLSTNLIHVCRYEGVCLSHCIPLWITAAKSSFNKSKLPPQHRPLCLSAFLVGYQTLTFAQTPGCWQNRTQIQMWKQPIWSKTPAGRKGKIKARIMN